jgi:hypothetical protein
MKPTRWTEPTTDELAHQEGERAYAEVCPPMSRAERRTAKGKLLVAQGELARATAAAEFWKQRAIERGPIMKWKLVPVEPTPEMIDAWNNDDSDEFRHAYRAMLEAAPQPPKLSNERIWEIYDELVADIAQGGSMFNFARAIEREIFGGEVEGHDN